MPYFSYFSYKYTNRDTELVFGKKLRNSNWLTLAVFSHSLTTGDNFTMNFSVTSTFDLVLDLTLVSHVTGIEGHESFSTLVEPAANALFDIRSVNHISLNYNTEFHYLNLFESCP